MAPQFRRIGDVAKRTGVSVRTLRYHDEIHLLSPSQHTAAGYRLYTAADIARLQQIKSLQQLGFSLKDIRTCLSRPDASAGVVRLHLAHLRERIELERKLCDRLEWLAAHVPSDTDVSLDTMLDAIEMMNMIEKYYTPEQIDQLRERQREVGEERIHRTEAQWKDLITQVRSEMDTGGPPTSARVRHLATRWMALVREFTGGDPDIERSLRSLYKIEPAVGNRYGIGPEMFAYISRATAGPAE